MNAELAAVLLGLSSAITWGAGDFSGGIASKNTPSYSVVLISQLLGGILLTVIALITAEPFASPNDLAWGALAGVFGAIALILFYRGLATGRMGVVAPVAAVVTAILPILIAFVLEGFPANLKLVGFALALFAVWIISGAGGQGRIALRELRLPVLAGVGFGLFLVFIDQVSTGSVFWPLTAARVASVTLLGLLALLTQRPLSPHPASFLGIALAGVFDAAGNVFFALASQAGRLDIASVLASLYPASTILLARFLLQERLSQKQWIGVAAALGSIILIAI